MNESRLLLITPDFPPNVGGVARYLGLLAEYFKDRVEVVSDAQTLMYRTIWPRWIKTTRLLLRRQRHYDVVLTSHVLPFGTAAYLASWFTQKPYVVIVHGMDVRLAQATALKRFFTRIIFKNARVVVANSNALAHEVAQTFGVPLPLVVYPCVTAASQSKAASLQNTSLFRSQNDPAVFLTVGRLVARKGHADMLTALSLLKQSSVMPPFEYHIVGSGPMEQTLKEMAAQLGLTEVQFHRVVSDEELQEYYKKAHLFVMPVQNDPIDKEGFGMVFIEAARHGVPSVSSAISGVDEAILERETGVLVPPHDPNILAKILLSLVQDETERARLGANARTRAYTEFTCEKQFAKLEPYL